MADSTARESIARWLFEMDWSTRTWDAAGNDKADYCAKADEYMSDPENLLMRAEAWDEGMAAAIENGYMARNDMTLNPYRPTLPNDRKETDRG